MKNLTVEVLSVKRNSGCTVKINEKEYQFDCRMCNVKKLFEIPNCETVFVEVVKLVNLFKQYFNTGRLVKVQQKFFEVIFEFENLNLCFKRCTAKLIIEKNLSKTYATICANEFCFKDLPKIFERVVRCVKITNSFKR